MREQDLLKDLEMPDLVKDDFYTYDPLVFKAVPVQVISLAFLFLSTTSLETRSLSFQSPVEYPLMIFSVIPSCKCAIRFSLSTC